MPQASTSAPMGAEVADLPHSFGPTFNEIVYCKQGFSQLLSL